MCTKQGCKVIKTFKDLVPAKGYSYTNAEAEKYFLDMVTKDLANTQFKHFSIESTFDHEKNTAHTVYQENLGTLEDVTYDLNQLKAFLIEIFSTLDYLYDKGILHMDIKPANVLVLSTKNTSLPTEIVFKSFSVKVPKVSMYAKIIDWGVSVDYKKNKFYELFEDKMSCLRPAYDLVRMLYFLSKEKQSNENKNFLHRIARAMFNKNEFPYIDNESSCSTVNQKIKQFKFRDLFLLNDDKGSLFDLGNGSKGSNGSNGSKGRTK